MKRALCWIFALWMVLCAAFSAAAEQEQAAWSWQEMRMEGEADSYVRCLLFSGGENAHEINAMVQEKARIQDYLTLLGQITSGSTGLKVDYQCWGDVENASLVSLVFSAQGKMLEGRPSQVYYPMVVDLENTSFISAEDVFTDVAAAEELLNAYLEEQVLPLLSTHLENNELFPVPMERFALDEVGVTFYYEVDQLSFLSGFSGAVTVPYTVLESVLNLAEDSALARMGLAENMLSVHDHTASMIQNAVSQGRLGALPLAVGMDLEDAFNLYRSTVDAGYYPGGAVYEVEDSRFWGTLLITDEQETAVTGMLAKEISLYGLVTGKTHRDTWLSLLGEPVFTLEMGESEATPYLLCPGISDYYTYGDYELMLHSDEEGVLYAVKISN